MDFYVANLIETAIISIGVLGLSGIAGWTVVQLRKHRGTPQLDSVTESMDRLRESVDALRFEVNEIAERLEFTERVMARLVDDGREPPPRLPAH